MGIRTGVGVAVVTVAVIPVVLPMPRITVPEVDPPACIDDEEIFPVQARQDSLHPRLHERPRVDENGRFISPDLMIALLGHYFLEERGEKGKVLQDIRSSKAVGEYLSPMGGEMVTWKVGRAYAAHKLREIDGIFGGELAGHYYFRDFFYSDSGIMASLIILGIISDLKAKGVSLSQIIGKIERYKNSGEINFRIEQKQKAMDIVRDYFTSLEKPVASFDFDGYRVEFPQWWFNIRPSNTEPYLRFIAEATTNELLDAKVSKVKELISGL